MVDGRRGERKHRFVVGRIAQQRRRHAFRRSTQEHGTQITWAEELGRAQDFDARQVNGRCFDAFLGREEAGHEALDRCREAGAQNCHTLDC